jgi:predicted phage tail protein
MTIGKKEEGIIQIVVAVIFIIGAFFISTRPQFL